MFVRRYFWEIASGIAVVLACILGLLYVERGYLFKPFGSYSRGHIMIDTKVFDSYYAVHGGAQLVVYAQEVAHDLTRANFHFTGHAVGDVLFQREGLGAVATCADSFEWGCLHEVMGMSYAAHGPTSLQELQKRCDEYPTEKGRAQCQHGLGHGLIYESNYDEKNMEKVLSVCDRVTTVRPIPWNDSCHAGVFMEFNEHYLTMEYAGTNGRPASTTAPFSACDGLTNKEHQALCVFWTIPWLHGKLFDFTYVDTSAFHELGSFCSRYLSSANLRDACFFSIGRSVGINTNLGPARVLSLCSAVSNDLSIQRVCLESAASVYAANSKVSMANAICKLVQDDPLRACRQKY